MFEWIKIAGVSAVLSAGVVAMSEIPVHADATASGKIYTDRLGEEGGIAARPTGRTAAAGVEVTTNQQSATGIKGDSLRGSPVAGCADLAWPYIPRQCLVAVDANAVRGAVRTITLEQRAGTNTSVLVRVPGPEVARR